MIYYINANLFFNVDEVPTSFPREPRPRGLEVLAFSAAFRGAPAAARRRETGAEVLARRGGVVPALHGALVFVLSWGYPQIIQFIKQH
jgi:hypothetical protein